MSRPRIAYTFGNHMHWVDMQWLWGYHVLPGSIRDMRKLVREAGVKGGVNFDAIGYEKLAAEDPEALAELKEAIAAGDIEVIGGSYGQPYGQFHGGESNVRQLIYGARTCRRLLGVWPKTFWEEEFYCFPQLPQMLIGAGYTGASLFFQWTWHTPEVPREDAPVIWWQAPDGSKLKTATRNALNLHQWPEDMEILLADLAANPPSQESGVPLIQQWLELMPSPDWMCRAEVILPRLRELLSDPRFEVIPTTLGTYLKASDPTVTRQYDPGEMWHGLSLGKNSDRMRRMSFEAEKAIMSAESLAAMLSLFGRPYAQWDVYPTWELEEAWRELLSAQHHDNCECEGLCGRVGEASYRRAFELAHNLGQLLAKMLGRRLPSNGFRGYNLNPLGWSRVSQFGAEVPAYGFVPCGDWKRKRGFRVEGDDAWFEDGAFRAHFDLKRAVLRQIWTADFPEGMLAEEQPLLELVWRSNGQLLTSTSLELAEVDFINSALVLRYHGEGMQSYSLTIDVLEGIDGFEVQFYPNHIDPEPGFGGAMRTRFELKGGVDEIIRDTPYGVHPVTQTSKGVRKYPEGDWMTSPQWFEDVEGALTGLTFVDLVQADGRGLLVAHDGTQQWFKTEQGAEAIINLYDPWDEDHWENDFSTLWLIPHGPLSHTERWTVAQEARAWCDAPSGPDRIGDLPAKFAPLRLDSAHVRVTAFYREIGDYAGRHTDRYAGEDIEYPFIVRLVELEGKDGEVDLIVAGPVAKAFKTNLLGQIEQELIPEEADPNALYATPDELAPFGIVPQRLRFTMRANEIATLYLDLLPGRKQTRDLDAKREIWATVHRVDS